MIEPPPRRDEVRPGGAAGVEDEVQLVADREVPVVVGRLRERLEARGGRVVVEDVDAAVDGRGLVDPRARRRGVAEVDGLHGRHRAAGGLHHRDGLAALGLLDVAADDGGALTGERERRGAALSTGRAGDERDLPLQAAARDAIREIRAARERPPRARVPAAGPAAAAASPRALPRRRSGRIVRWRRPRAPSPQRRRSRGRRGRDRRCPPRPSSRSPAVSSERPVSAKRSGRRAEHGAGTSLPPAAPAAGTQHRDRGEQQDRPSAIAGRAGLRRERDEPDREPGPGEDPHRRCRRRRRAPGSRTPRAAAEAGRRRRSGSARRRRLRSGCSQPSWRPLTSSVPPARARNPSGSGLAIGRRTIRAALGVHAATTTSACGAACFIRVRSHASWVAVSSSHDVHDLEQVVVAGPWAAWPTSVQAMSHSAAIR